MMMLLLACMRIPVSMFLYAVVHLHHECKEALNTCTRSFGKIIQNYIKYSRGSDFKPTLFLSVEDSGLL